MNPALEGVKAVIDGFWQGLQPYIIPGILGLVITLVVCIIIVKIIWKK